MDEATANVDPQYDKFYFNLILSYFSMYFQS